MAILIKHKTHLIKGISILIILVTCTLFCACHKQTVWHTYHAIPTQGWLRTDTLCFEVAMPDSQTHYNLSLDIRNRNTYPYQNILLGISYESPDYDLLYADTLQLTLSNSQGTWTGKGWGGLYQSRFRIGNLPIQQTGIYHIKINHLLTDSTLQGINDVGILLERTH